MKENKWKMQANRYRIDLDLDGDFLNEKLHSVQILYHLFIYVLPLEIQLSKGEGWDPIKRFNPDTFLYLSQDMDF